MAFYDYKRLVVFEPEEATLLLPIVNVCWDLIEKAFEYRLDELDTKKVKWFRQISSILNDSKEMSLDCVIELYIGTHDEVRMIKDLLFDVMPYYNESTRGKYLSAALKFDKVYQYHYHLLMGDSSQ